MLKILRWLPCITLLVCLSATNVSLAGIIPIGPFVGTSSEDFDNTGVEGATQTLDVFGGLATIRNLTAGGALKVELSSSLDGDLVVPRSSPWMVGQLGIAEWTFAQPVSQFGGYFENNSRFDDAVVDFYDRSGSLIDSLTATVPRMPRPGLGTAGAPTRRSGASLSRETTRRSSTASSGTMILW
jgi:hypothetical protein